MYIDTTPLWLLGIFFVIIIAVLFIGEAIKAKKNPYGNHYDYFGPRHQTSDERYAEDER